MFAALNQLMSGTGIAPAKYDSINITSVNLTSPSASTITGSGSHSAAAGATVFVLVYTAGSNQDVTTWPTRSATYDGVSMTQVDSVNFNNGFGNTGWIEMYRITNAPAGTKTWSISIGGGTAGTLDKVIAGSLSYTNAKYFGPLVKNFSTSGTALDSGIIQTSANDAVLQTFGAYDAFSSFTLSGYSGGTVRSGPLVIAGVWNYGFVTGDAIGTVDAHFTVTSSDSNTWWASLSIDMSPVPKVYFKSANSTTSTSVSIPAHNVGDIILLFAYKNNSTIPPTKPAASGTVPAWVDIDNNTGANTNSSRTAYFVATATNTTSGTWTGATNMTAVVLTGQNASPIGGHAESGGASTTSLVAPAITLTHTSGTSMQLSFFGCAGGGSFNSPPSGYDQLATTTYCAVNGKAVTTSDGSYTQTVTAAGVYRSAVVEVIA